MITKIRRRMDKNNGQLIPPSAEDNGQFPPTRKFILIEMNCLTLRGVINQSQVRM